MRSIEPRPVLLGGLTATAVALPVGVAGQLLVDDASSSVTAFVFLVPILLAFIAGGFVAARMASARPLTNGALAALGAFAVIQGVGLVRRLAGGEAVAPASVAFAAFLAYSCGLVGALVAHRVSTARPMSGPDR